MDNRFIDVVSEGNEKILKLALDLVWSSAAGGKATHYQIYTLKRKVQYYTRPLVTEADIKLPNVTTVSGQQIHIWHSETTVVDATGIPTLVLFWHEGYHNLKLPFPMDAEQSAWFINSWLANASYGHEPDHDGDNGKGWRLFTEAWGKVAAMDYSIIGVQTAWAMYGK